MLSKSIQKPRFRLQKYFNLPYGVHYQRWGLLGRVLRLSDALSSVKNEQSGVFYTETDFYCFSALLAPKEA